MLFLSTDASLESAQCRLVVTKLSCRSAPSPSYNLNRIRRRQRMANIDVISARSSTERHRRHGFLVTVEFQLNAKPVISGGKISNQKRKQYYSVRVLSCLIAVRHEVSWSHNSETVWPWITKIWDRPHVLPCAECDVSSYFWHVVTIIAFERNFQSI